ncbi:hypothetical protein SCHPADRAFT_903975 [Schizopora paradoxa]|uniref:Uncharacterized protein n=1 Tax=Schizopora paradoxa TaxID=27342 RepID=A0A0H2RPU9_9AGAM|nr:hypothetical protein SCHPADRAFT_903975 [Schizopora paradoxa]
MVRRWQPSQPVQSINLHPHLSQVDHPILVERRGLLVNDPLSWLKEKSSWQELVCLCGCPVDSLLVVGRIVSFGKHVPSFSPQLLFSRAIRRSFANGCRNRPTPRHHQRERNTVHNWPIETVRPSEAVYACGESLSTLTCEFPQLNSHSRTMTLSGSARRLTTAMP